MRHLAVHPLISTMSTFQIPGITPWPKARRWNWFFSVIWQFLRWLRRRAASNPRNPTVTHSQALVLLLFSLIRTSTRYFVPAMEKTTSPELLRGSKTAEAIWILEAKLAWACDLAPQRPCICRKLCWRCKLAQGRGRFSGIHWHVHSVLINVKIWLLPLETLGLK
jgi:hypothetical protein